MSLDYVGAISGRDVMRPTPKNPVLLLLILQQVPLGCNDFFSQSLLI